MDEKAIRHLLNSLKEDNITIDEVIRQLRMMPYENIEGFAHLDHHRELRCGFPEVVFGQGKSPEQLIGIINRLAQINDKVLVTRLSQDIYDRIRSEIPIARYHPIPRILIIDKSMKQPGSPGILVITAGTIDISVAEEAAMTAELMGNSVERLFDVGVAGIHRLLSQVERIQKAQVIIVVAGMDGALPSVVGGLVSVPVIAVPTSAGYGASFHGLAALLTMLNSCANGVAVVNIDNGFGAGYLASLINQKRNTQ